MRQHQRGVELRSRIERIASRGADFTAARTELDRELRRVIGYDVGALSTMDPATMCWTSCFVSGVDHDDGWERIVYEHEFGADEINSYGELARAVTPVGRLSAATGGDLTLVGRYPDLLEPLGASDEMRAVLRSHGACWGTLTLYRRHPAGPFTADDERTLLAVTGAVADLFRLTMLRAAVDTPGALAMPPGLITLDEAGTAVETTAHATEWLAAIDDRPRLPSVIRSLAAAARSGDGLARAVVPSRAGGWIGLHASALLQADGSRGRIAVIVEAARPIAINDLVAEAYGLTQRERDVASCITRGLANKEIAQELSISPFTVQDHVKAVIAKTSVPNRGSLVALLQGEHYQARSDAGQHPGPYGWYLDGSAVLAG